MISASLNIAKKNWNKNLYLSIYHSISDFNQQKRNQYNHRKPIEDQQNLSITYEKPKNTHKYQFAEKHRQKRAVGNYKKVPAVT